MTAADQLRGGNYACPLCKDDTPKGYDVGNLLTHLAFAHPVPFAIQTVEPDNIACFCGRQFSRRLYRQSLNTAMAIEAHWYCEGGLQAHLFETMMRGRRD